MSSRALRKLQREQEQQQQLENAVKISSPEDDESEEEAVKPKAVNAFDMLIDNGDGGDAESEGELSSEIGEATVTPAARNMDITSTVCTTAKTKAKPRSKKKRNKKSGKDEKAFTATKTNHPAQNTSNLDEIDLALKSLKIKDRDGSYSLSNVRPDDTNVELCRLLATETKHLNALNEMKRLFGNVVLDHDNEAPGTPGRRRGRGTQMLDLGGAFAGQNSQVSRGQGLAGLALRRNVFMLGKAEWPKATSGGLGMEIVEKQKDGITEFRFVHNTAYQDVQRQFETCVESLEPQRMIQLLQFNPYHISTLLQVSEIAKQQGDHSVSGDLLERALFSFGRSVHSSFTTALSEGKARLDFRRPENREFWLAAWRYVTNLGQRGTWRTTYEWAKLLLSLDPEGDPYCILLTLDQMAIRGGQAEHFLKLAGCPLLYNGQWSHRPNISISAALAKYKLKQAQTSRASLGQAIKDYPWIFVRLFQELNITHIPKSIWGKEPRSIREKFDCEIYVHGAKDLWNTPEAISFLVEVVETVDVDTSDDYSVQEDEITLNEARHVVLSGVPALLSLLPRAFTTTLSTSSSDPIPPPDSLPSYSTISPARALPDHQHTSDLPRNEVRGQNATARSAETDDEEQELQGLRGFFARLIPWLGQGETLTQIDMEDAATQESLDRAATDSGIAPEIIEERGTRLLELVRRVLGRQQQQQQQEQGNGADVPRWPEIDPSGFTVDEASDDEIFQEFTQDVPENTNSPIEELDPPYDDARNQHWLAGVGLIRLRDAVAVHGHDPCAWLTSTPPGATEAAAALAEYVKRVLQLEDEKKRDFILDYALPQGTSREVREMVIRNVGYARGAGGY